MNEIVIDKSAYPDRLIGLRGEPDDVIVRIDGVAFLHTFFFRYDIFVALYAKDGSFKSFRKMRPNSIAIFGKRLIAFESRSANAVSCFMSTEKTW
jgi:hypothetical protein